MPTTLSSNKPMARIVGATKSLGRYIAWEPSCCDRKQYIHNHLPQHVDRNPFIKTFKEDIEVDYIIEKLQDVEILYITAHGRTGDELYYFRINDCLYHGQKIWSKWHSFLHLLPELKPSRSIEHPCFFVGSRPNYTHQMVDFLPSLLLRNEIGEVIPLTATNLIGCHNSILEQALTYDRSKITSGGQFLELSHLGESRNSLTWNGWNIKCIHFRELYLVRHLSVFKAFTLLRDTFANGLDKVQDLESTGQDLTHRAIFLARSDNRILNQKQLSYDLSRYYSVTVSKQLSTLSILDKLQYLANFQSFILPPGSENINAFFLANHDSSFIQMIPREFTSLLESPFHSFAALRYNLPFLHRTVFWEPSSLGTGINSASWSLNNIPPIVNPNNVIEL